MSRIGDPQLKQRAEALATLLSSDQHPQSISDEVTAALQQLPQTQLEAVINYRNTRQNGRTAVHLAACKGLWQSLEVLLKNGGYFVRLQAMGVHALCAYVRGYKYCHCLHNT